MLIIQLLFILWQPLNSDAAELLEILTRFEVEGLCFAYDRVLTESNKTLVSLSLPDDIHGEFSNKQKLFDFI